MSPPVDQLLDRLDREPSPALWAELDRLLVTERECWVLAGFTALPRLTRLAESGQEQAVELAAIITRMLHRTDREIDPPVLLHRLAQARLAACDGAGLVERMQDVLSLGGYPFWATISMDFTDEHYQVGCPGCGVQLAVVIGEYGRYSAIRDYDTATSTGSRYNRPPPES